MRRRRAFPRAATHAALRAPSALRRTAGSGLRATHLLLCVAGCSAGSSHPPGLPPDAGVDRPTADAAPRPESACDPTYAASHPTDPVVDGPGETYDYVINRLLVDEGAEPPTGRAFYGFNLDGRASPATTARQLLVDCSHGDYFSVLDPDQNLGACSDRMVGGGGTCQGGVDNQLPNIQETLGVFTRAYNGQALLNRRIDGGQQIVLIRVAGVHGALGPSLMDPDVTIRVYPVAWPTFGDCTAVQRGRQTYAVDDRSLREPGNLDKPVLDLQGCIDRGRLRQRSAGVAGAVTTFSIPLIGEVLAPLHDLHLRFDLAEEEGARGNLGGTMLLSEIVPLLQAAFGRGMYERSIENVAIGFVDVARSTRGAPSCDPPDGLVSVGLGFTALRARIAAGTVSGPAPGVCGAP